MLQHSATTAAVYLCLFLWCPTTRADIIVDVQNASIEIGGTSSVDVLISSTGTDSFDFASYVFAITNVGSPSSALEFVNPQITTEGGDANYVFKDDLDAGALAFSVNNPSEVEGADGTMSLAPITLNSSQRLLTRLDLAFALGSAPKVGDQYRITLLTASAFGGSDTFFQDNSGAFPIDRTIDSRSFAPLGLGGGLLTVSAVPEPNALTMACATLLAFGYLRNRSSRAGRKMC